MSSWKDDEMLHVDEGQLHALLDEALDAGEADTVRQHIAACGECAVRYEDERAIRARANAILELARPLPGTIPPFETVLQRAQKSSASRVTVPGPMRLAWAATIVLALGIGWLSRDFAPRGDLASESTNAGDAMADAAPPSAEAPPPPPPVVSPAPEPIARNAAGIGAVTGAPAAGAAAPPVREERAMQELVAKTQGQTAASNAAGQAAQAPPPQQVQGQVADLSSLRRDTAAARAARASAAEAKVAAPPPAAVMAAPPPAPRWEYLDLASAEQRIGSTILVIPGLQVDSVAVSRVGAGYSVRIIHRLPGDGLFELRQEPMVAAQVLEQNERRRLDSVADRAGFFTVSVPRGNLQLIGRAQLPADSIRALLNRAR
jgi:hypothetical protein